MSAKFYTSSTNHFDFMGEDFLMHFPINSNFDLIFLKYKKMELSVFAFQLFTSCVYPFAKDCHNYMWDTLPGSQFTFGPATISSPSPWRILIELPTHRPEDLWVDELIGRVYSHVGYDQRTSLL
jgi:hypothetical protein